MKFKLLTATFAALLIGAATTASAATYKLTFDGVVSAGAFDLYNTFGLGGAIAGQAVSVSFLYDANPGDTTLASSEVKSFGVTINGTTFKAKEGVNDVPDMASALRNDAFNVLAAWGDVTYPSPYSTFNRSAAYAGAIFGVFFSNDLTTPFKKTGLNCPTCAGSFVSYVVGPSRTDYFLGNYSITSAQLSAVPVPATLPLLATALAGVGAVAARRRKKAA